MFLEEDDVEMIRLDDPARREETYEVIQEKAPLIKPSMNKEIAVTQFDTEALAEFSRIYEDAQNLIREKDAVIQDLSYKLWKTETELKNSISIVEYKSATFLLESAKSKNEEDRTDLTKKIDSLEKELQKRGWAVIALAILFVLVLWFALIFFFTRF